MAAPWSKQARESALMASELSGTLGLISGLVMPLMATSMMTGTFSFATAAMGRT